MLNSKLALREYTLDAFDECAKECADIQSSALEEDKQRDNTEGILMPHSCKTSN